MATDNDVILTDYLTQLLSPASPIAANQDNVDDGLISSIEPQACLQVRVGGQDLLLPLVDLSGM
tara:strand:+ start:294 stop:485 length:192 start_codon:yes stop_codon:yes gene_type:complete